ncbi:NAD(P)/FAD-dependent oxidoreductase [Alteraurantiacibacter aestuarii]|uniref:NAD(P)-binding protein n=1 Tax=Alteraurantiacibacter aestuarii TaxID=650004 RepID=A0A844ZJT0_9SPHN|nr:NAD(P)/FAD-dependent oxidoreductase [Alteraurantiacibacter aestuarii]MXO88038.1 NAD(P)-binding protein [Alteraurantiacibacter aestuarii]
MPDSAKLDALIVGAGFSGLYMLHKLRQEGFSAQVVEAGSGVGGTWFWNRYPGARCDIPSLEYSYSFDPQLEQEWEWTERYAAQGEILSYLDHVADRYDLRRDIAFDTRVTAAHWDEATSRWQVETDTGGSFDVQFLILATGALSEPKMPDLPGLEKFEGKVLHTAKWDDSVDLKGKTVCHFGTGSSGIQAVAAMSEYVGHLTVFQRTPSYAVPANNRPLEDGEQEAAKATYREKRDVARHSPLGFAAPPMPGSAKTFAPAALKERLEQAWNAGTTGLLNAFEDLLFDETSNELAAKFARGKIADAVRDPDDARKLTPDYPLGSRRLCSEIGFYDALNRDNVELVDVREEKVVDITAHAVITDKASYAADAIVLATGFDACVGAVLAIDIRGRGGQQIGEEWANGPRAFLGLTVSGFPNMFAITGPGSPSVLSNVVVSIEQHVEWVARCLCDMRASGKRVIEADADAEQEWMRHVDEVAQTTLFPRADSWYKGRTRDGRDVFMPYVGGVGAYRAKCDEIAAAGYEGFALSS